MTPVNATTDNTRIGERLESEPDRSGPVGERRS